MSIRVDEARGILGSDAPVGVLVGVVRLWIARDVLVRLGGAAVQIGSAGVARGGPGSPDVRRRGVATRAAARVEAVARGGRGRDAINGAALHGRELRADGIGRVVEAARESRCSTLSHPRLRAGVELEWLRGRVEGRTGTVLVEVHATTKLR